MESKAALKQDSLNEKEKSMADFQKLIRNKTLEQKQKLQGKDLRKNHKRLEQYSNYLYENYPYLSSIPDFNMKEFKINCSFTRHLGSEILIILVDNGLNVNYHRIKDGLSPLQFAIRTG